MSPWGEWKWRSDILVAFASRSVMFLRCAMPSQEPNWNFSKRLKGVVQRHRCVLCTAIRIGLAMCHTVSAGHL